MPTGINLTFSEKDDIERKYKSGMTIRNIAKEHNLSTSAIYRNLQKRGIVFKRGKVVDVDFSQKPELAYIEGVLCGDGWAYNNKKTSRYFIGIDAIDKEFVTKFKKSLEAVGLNVWLGKSKDNCWRALGNSKLLYLWHNEKPHRGFYTDKEKRAFLEGFYESDGTSNPKCLQYCNSDLDLLKAAQEMLEDLGIETTIQGPYMNKQKTQYYFLYVKAKSRMEFKKLIKPVNKFNRGNLDG